ncbi:MAG: NTP transferase domain-containing protein, partial [Candidatus Omnitrophica bacterium]|nr:NTP transferase domain-containing protein [Candidatus Omnitrophota bacterium]
MKNIAAIILAAGKGVRMKSATPKVLHSICGRPMVSYVLDLTRELKLRTTVAVLGVGSAEVKKILPPGVKVAVQIKLVGTADAVKVALTQLKGFKGTVLILYGDIPLLKKETVDRLIKHHMQNDLDATILTAQVKKPAGYGRILRDKYSSISGIIEDKDADDVQKAIKEINTGIICFNKEKLAAALKDVRPNNRKKEYYLTDIIGLFHKKGYLIESVKIADLNEALGINSRVELAQANSIMQRRLNERYMHMGITITDPVTTFISFGTKIGLDTVIYPFTVIERDVKIGKRCFVGPFAHLREGTRLEDDVVAGNFIEITRSNLKAKTLAKHFSYIGDTRIGRNVNIGAGTVTANFDKGKKNITVIKDGASIGSDTILVAPVTVGRRAVTGAGSVVA